MPTLSWTGTTSGSTNLGTTPTTIWQTPGTYDITVDVPVIMTFRGVAAGGCGSAGGGGGGAFINAMNVTLQPLKSYRLIVGAGILFAAGGNTSLVNTTDTVTLALLTGGVVATGATGGNGGVVSVGTGGGPGGKGGNQDGSGVGGVGGGPGGGGGGGTSDFAGGTGGSSTYAGGTGGGGGRGIGGSGIGGGNLGQGGSGGVDGGDNERVAGGGGGGGGVQLTGTSFGRGGGGGGAGTADVGSSGSPGKGADGAAVLVYVSTANVPLNGFSALALSTVGTMSSLANFLASATVTIGTRAVFQPELAALTRFAISVAGPLAASLHLDGVTKNSAGGVLGGCTVKLYRTSSDALVATTTSDGSGVYHFTVPDNANTYYAVAYHPGSPDLAGTTLNTLTGT